MFEVPFHKPIIPQNVIGLISDSLSTGWLTTGPKVAEFENILHNYLESDYIIAVNSCTAALHLALAARDIGKGDSFIAPTYTFVASVEVGEYLGAKPVLIDSDLVNFNLDLNQVEDILKRDTANKIKAIIPVHFAGRAVDMAVDLRLSNITFADPQSSNKMPEIWASADIAIISLKQHIPGAVPSKLYEAMSSGSPVVMIANGEPADIVNNSRCGLVVSPGNIDGIVVAVETLTDNKDLRIEMGKNGFSEVKNNFNRKDILNKFHNYVITKLNNE